MRISMSVTTVISLLCGILMFPLLFSDLLADENGGASPEDMERNEKARALYHENCAMCHGYDGVPILPGAPNFVDGDRLDKKDHDLLKTLQDGKADMPGWKEVLSATEQSDVLTYVRGIAGDQVFQDKCNSCHGKSVPPLSKAIPKSKEKLNNLRGPMDLCNGCDVEETMNQRQIIDVIKFLRTLPRDIIKEK